MIETRAKKNHAPDSHHHRQEYLKLFEGYIDFLNLDVEAYLASMTHTTAAAGGGDDDDDDDGGLGVATVNLAALRAVLAKHQVRVASQPDGFSHQVALDSVLRYVVKQPENQRLHVNL